MNEETLELLGFPQVGAILADMADTPMGRAALARTGPLASLEAIQYRFGLTAECIRKRQETGPAGLAHLEDPSETIETLAVSGSSLSPPDFLTLRDLFLTGGKLRADLRGGEFPKLAESWREVEDFGPLAREIERVVDPSGEVLESADPELAAVRRRHRRSREKAQAALSRLLSGPKAKFLVQEPYVTQRYDRYVIPVKIEHQREVPGVVHGASSSGATLFVEPFSVVEVNNEILYCRDREQEITARILRRLTEKVRARLEGLRRLVQKLGELDALQACAAFADRFGCVLPALNQEGKLNLREARHPLLTQALGDASVTPISLALGEGRDVLVVSGPNAGGKTVTLKTIGLFALMAHSGLPVPAADAQLPFFRQILADIGDHQSISEHLSTFSAHMLRVREMMASLDPPALILLDEIGAGTDPDYGAALGIAVMERFRENGAMVVATTHHQAVKQFAAAQPHVLNASVSLDPATHRPNYRLTLGVAGESSPLEIAEQLGLPQAVLKEARGLLDDRQVLAEQYLARLREELASLEQARRELSARTEEFKRRESELSAEFLKKDEVRRKQIDKALDRLTGEFKREAERFLKRTKDRFEAARRRSEVQRKQAHLKESFRRKMSLAIDEPAARRGQQADPPASLSRGDAVYDNFFKRRGKVLSLEEGRAVIEVEGKRMERPVDQLTKIESREVVRKPSRHVTLNVVEDSDPELHLVGCTVDESLERLDKFLDRAFLTDLAEVRIIHGFGKGRLRRAVSAFLAEHAQVLSHRTEGGVTVARLREDSRNAV